MRTMRRFICSAAALLVSSAVLADDGLYIGGSVGQNEEHFDPATYNVRGDDTGYKIAVGYRPLDVIAGELDYIGFGRASGGVNYADTYGVRVSALAFLPIPLVDVFGRVGAINWRTNVTSPYDSFRRTGTDLSYGAGAGMSWGKLGARIEYELFDVAHANTMNLATIGVTWTVF